MLGFVFTTGYQRLRYPRNRTVSAPGFASQRMGLYPAGAEFSSSLSSASLHTPFHRSDVTEMLEEIKKKDTVMIITFKSVKQVKHPACCLLHNIHVITYFLIRTDVNLFELLRKIAITNNPSEFID